MLTTRNSQLSWPWCRHNVPEATCNSHLGFRVLGLLSHCKKRCHFETKVSALIRTIIDILFSYDVGISLYLTNLVEITEVAEREKWINLNKGISCRVIKENYEAYSVLTELFWKVLTFQIWPCCSVPCVLERTTMVLKTLLGDFHKWWKASTNIR